MHSQVLLVLVSFGVAVFGDEPSNLVRRSLGFPNYGGFPSRYGGDGGFYAGMFAGQGGGVGGWGGMGGGGGNSFRVSVNVACNPQIPYVDECQQRCYCQDDCIICPDNGGNGCANGMTPCVNQCGGSTGISFMQECNTCLCTDIGQVCSGMQC